MKLLFLISIASLAAGMTPSAHPQAATPAPSYAVLSLIGDKLDIVTHRPQVGSVIDNNVHEPLTLDRDELDTVALKRVGILLHEIAPGAPVALLEASTPAVFDDQDKLFDGDRARLPPDVEAAVGQEHATTLVLLTKHRGDTRMAASNGHLGSGKLEGLGFYVDQNRKMKRSDTGGIGHGFLSSFVYVDVSLVDVASGTVVRRATIAASTTISAARNPDGVDAWGALTPEQKVATLGRILSRELTRVVPELVSPATAPASVNGPAANR